MATKTLLIGDIGGTNARLALAEAEGDGFVEERTLACDSFNSPEAAINEYLSKIGAPSPDIICFAVAGRIVGESVKFTNNSWHISAGSLRATFDCRDAHLLNDFEAIAWSLPSVNRAHTAVIGNVPEGDLTRDDYSVCVIGPGTGLGTGGLLRRQGRLLPLVSEAGHVGFAPESELQADILKVLQSRYRRVSDERLVSGMGIENIYWALGKLGDHQLEPISDAQIFELAACGDDEIGSCAIDLFFEILGQAAGNLVLSMGAWEGAYVAGGITQRHTDLLLESDFRQGFENKGRHSALLAAVPTCVITHPQPGLLGAARVARRLLAAS